MGHELSITVEHPQKPGKWMNIPLVVPGNDMSGLTPGQHPSTEQVDRAIGHALGSEGSILGEYDSVDEAVGAAKARSESFGGHGH
jgi:hypothetical protein